MSLFWRSVGERGLEAGWVVSWMWRRNKSKSGRESWDGMMRWSRGIFEHVIQAALVPGGWLVFNDYRRYI